MENEPQSVRDQGAHPRARSYMACLDLSGRLCVVVGGGSPAAREAAALLECAARVRVIASAPMERLTMLAQVGRIELLARPYVARDLAGATLAFALADDPEVNAQVASDARAAGILCHVVDGGAASDFAVPAELRRGGATIAIATDDDVPGFAERLRDLIAVGIGPEHGQALGLYASVRSKIAGAPPERLSDLWSSLYALDLARVIHDRGVEAARAALAGWLRRQRLD